MVIQELLDILEDKKHERHEDMKNWAENGFSTWYADREYVDIEEINMRLEDYKEHAKFLLGDRY